MNQAYRVWPTLKGRCRSTPFQASVDRALSILYPLAGAELPERICKALSHLEKREGSKPLKQAARTAR